MSIIIKGKRGDTVRAGGKNDLIYTGPGNDDVHGGGGNDLIVTGSGNDFADGGSGVDLVSTGTGNDVAVFVAAENSGPRWRLPDVYDGGSGTDALRIVLTAEEWAREDVRADVLSYVDFLESGGRGAFKFQSLNLIASSFETLNLVVDGLPVDPNGEPSQVVDLSGSTQNETVRTGSGNDIVKTGSGNDVIETGSGDDFVESGAGDDTVTIGDGDDVVRTGDGNDTVIAGQGGGNDIIDLGSGRDTVKYKSIGFGIQIDLLEADQSALDLGNGKTAGDLLVDAVGSNYVANTPAGTTKAIDPANASEIGVDLLIGIENAEGGSGNDRISGSNIENSLYGAAGNDELNGLDGDDTLYGGQGDDTLNGGGGDDILDGGPGADRVDGGAGMDTLVLEGASTEYEFVADGSGGYTVARDGTPQSSWDNMKAVEFVAFSDTTLPTWAITDFNFIVGDNTAETIDGTPGRDDIRGNGGDDRIFGNNEEDWITGGSGNDLIVGSTGSYDDDNFIWDAVDYSREGGSQGVTVNLAAGTATDTLGDTDTLVGIERIVGTNFADSITGSDKDDAFDPHGGDDFVDGGAGWDSLLYQLSSDKGGFKGIVVEFSDTVEGSGTVVSDPFGRADTFVNIEAVRGNEFDDVFMGGAGTQEFRGHDGADTFDGRNGFDLVSYHDDAAYGGFGGINVDMDIVDAEGYASLTDSFGANDRLKNVEEIRGTGAADVMLGDGSANFFRGEAGADTLDGRGGDDELQGELGNDILRGGAGEDFIAGGAGDDTIDGGSGNDWLDGGEGSDVFQFFLNSGDDTIEDFETNIDSISLGTGIAITSVSYANVGGGASDDTIVELSTGALITLLDTTVAPDNLLVA